jgi:hypothetical protein
MKKSKQVANLRDCYNCNDIFWLTGGRALSGFVARPDESVRTGVAHLCFRFFYRLFCEWAMVNSEFLLLVYGLPALA